MEFTYQQEILEQLLGHGIRPVPGTRPALVARFVNDLYRYELRRLKARLAGREFPQPAYAGLVVALRHKYPLVSVPVRFWTVPGMPAEPDDVPLC